MVHSPLQVSHCSLLNDASSVPMCIFLWLPTLPTVHLPTVTMSPRVIYFLILVAIIRYGEGGVIDEDSQHYHYIQYQSKAHKWKEDIRKFVKVSKSFIACVYSRVSHSLAVSIINYLPSCTPLYLTENRGNKTNRRFQRESKCRRRDHPRKIRTDHSQWSIMDTNCNRTCMPSRLSGMWLQLHRLQYIVISREYATLHLAASVGPSVRPVVRPSVRPSVTLLNCERFSHYCSCPTIRDWIAMYPALFPLKCDRLICIYFFSHFPL